MVLTAVNNNLARSAFDEDEDEVVTTKRGGHRIVEDSEEEEENAVLSMVMDDSEEEDSDEQEAPRRAAAKPPRPAPSRKMKQQPAPRRRRRRSSARFLRLTGRFEEEEEQDEEEQDLGTEQEHLGEMYKRAIRMNAENRINAGNSWGLHLIENIDKFLVDEQEHEVEGQQRVNFTKASCTLDASVKIYSYRVDDVHLTSYKVLANLNRTETGKKDNRVLEQIETGGEETMHTAQRAVNASNERRGVTDTLESNLANINVSKLDSAFDIDPLFHKMSKTFDEGGAKGLLLVNLGVGANGCNIVFDSKEEAASIAQDQEKEDERTVSTREEGMIDISSLNKKLESMLGGASIKSIPLVPQLRTLREEFVQLDAEGFVDHKAHITKSRRYAASQDEEKEAEMSIHQDALERSRASLGTLAQEMMSQAEDSFAAEDFGGDDDGGDDDFGFSDFVAADENGARYSSISFQDEGFIDDAPPGTLNTQSTTTALLNAICSGSNLGGNDYEYFDAATVEKLTTGNVWAGSAHWKKTERLRRKRTAPAEPKKRKKKDSKKRVLIDLSKAPCLDDVLRAPPKSKRGADPLQLSKATKTKHGKADNLLPPDAGIGIEQLFTLFLRPNTVLGKADDKKGKTVGFNTNVESFGAGFDNGGDDDSLGGGDDGPGFEFADNGNEDFVINELEGVRKIDKIQVGYATVDKKIDVKRLKKDLWSELETNFVIANEEKESNDDIDRGKEVNSLITFAEEPKRLSFKKTVQDMEGGQAQSDVTLPFYFICLLHLANEKGLRLESNGLEDFLITQENGAAPSFGTLPNESASGKSTTTIAEQRERRAKELATYQDMESDEDSPSE